MRQAMMFSKRGTSAADVDARIAAAIAGVFPHAITGNYYDAAHHDGALGTFGNSGHVMAANRLYGSVVMLPAGSYDRMGVGIGAAAAAGKLLRMVLYRFGSDGLPGALLLNPGADLAADALAVVDHTIALTLSTATLCIAAIWSDGTPSVHGWTGGGRNVFGRNSSGASSSRQTLVYRDVTFGTPPASFGAVTGYTATSVPAIRFRAA